MADVPLRQRREAVLLELEQQAPFDEPRGWVFWQGGLACVWYWPKILQERALGSSATAAQPNPVPETALWPELKPGGYRWLEQPAEGLYLLQYQHPRSGLYEKRYAGPISAGEATAWLQRHGAEVAEAAALQASKPPLIGSEAPRGESLSPRSSSLEQRVFPATAALLGFLILVYGIAIVRAEWETNRISSDRQALQAEVQDVIELRNRAAELQAANLRLAELRQPSQLALASLIADTLDISSVRLVRWNYRDDQLEVSWQAGEQTPDATYLIRQLEALPALSNVQAQVNADGVVEIIMTITGIDLAVNASDAAENQPQSTAEENPDA